MGAQAFYTRARGKTAREAFQNEVDDAQYEHGHGGYTGTIAEKGNFTLIAVPEGEVPEDFAERLVEAADPRVNDKWGPAGCVRIGEGEWLFFGWASS